MPCLIVIVPSSPSSTRNRHQHLRQTCTQLPGPGLRIPRTFASRCSIKLVSLDYMFIRSAARPPSILDHLVGIRAARAAIEGGQQQLYRSHPLLSLLVPRPTASMTTDWSVMRISSSRSSSLSEIRRDHRGSCGCGPCQWMGESGS